MKQVARTREQWLRWQLRLVSYKWPARSEALRRARIERGIYRCAVCKKKYRNKQISLDHKDPVINPAKGWEGVEIYVNRLFCAAGGFQVLCKKCHDKKTKIENAIRLKWKKKRD